MIPEIDFPQSVELTDTVRTYVAALIRNNEILPVKYKKHRKKKGDETNGDIIDELEFGVSDSAAVAKMAQANRRKAEKEKKKPNKKGDLGSQRPDISEIVNSVVIKYTDDELAALAEQARLALARAGELAGEPVIYCCAHIRKERLHDCKSGARTKWRYKQVAKLVEGGDDGQ
jgi:hypothetical protein